MKRYQISNVTLDDKTSYPAYVVVGKDWNGFALPYFTLQQGKRLCEALNANRKNEWMVMNLTDGIVASNEMTKVAAEKFIQELQLRFKTQGYYLSANNERIRPEDVKLEVRPVELDDETTESKYDIATDTFIIQEPVNDGEYGPVEYKGEDIYFNDEKIHVYPIGTGNWIWSIDTQLN